VHFIFPVASTSKHDKPKSADFLEEWRSYLQDSKYYPELDEWYVNSGIENKQAIINARDCEYIISKMGLKAYEGKNKFVIIWMVEKLFHSAAMYSNTILFHMNLCLPVGLLPDERQSDASQF